VTKNFLYRGATPVKLVYSRSMISRRHFIKAIAATLATPAVAQTSPWQASIDRARALDQCHGLIISQAGHRQVAELFRGPSLSRAVPIKSVSKSLVSALTGAALDRGELPAITAKMGDIAPQLIPPSADPRVSDITIEHLITMQAGLERTSGANYGSWVNSHDWVANALSRPMITAPGSGMLYSTGSFHILGAVLTEISGKSLLKLARERIGTPLQIGIPAWTRDPQGRYLGGNEMHLTLPAMIRFGELYRLKGRWQGQQVLSADWVTQSFLPRTRSRFSGLQYGYGWFLGRAGSNDYALARGYGGQIICICPALDLTLAITSDPKRPARSAGYFGDLQNLIETQIIPTARDLQS